MDDIIDLLQVRIEKAKRELPPETINAINAVDWRTAILEMRTDHEYTFEQLGDLELETELVLCGLVSPENYPKELEKRMGISKAAVNELINEMNDLVFKKIREKFIENTERKKVFQRSEQSEQKNTNDTQILSSVGIKIIKNEETLPILEKLELPTEKPAENREYLLKKIEKPEFITTKQEAHPILAQKLSGSFKVPTTKTDHTLENITKSDNTNNGVAKSPKIDPYREIPE